MARDYDRSAIPAVYNLEAVEPYRDEPGFRQAIFRGIDQLVGFGRVDPEKPESEPHTHPYEQVIMCVDGRIAFLVDGERVELEAFDTLVVPPEVPHTSRAIEGETAKMVAIWPLREDRIEGTTYQKEFPNQ